MEVLEILQFGKQLIGRNPDSMYSSWTNLRISDWKGMPVLLLLGEVVSKNLIGDKFLRRRRQAR